MITRLSNLTGPGSRSEASQRIDSADSAHNSQEHVRCFGLWAFQFVRCVAPALARAVTLVDVRATHVELADSSRQGLTSIATAVARKGAYEATQILLAYWRRPPEAEAACRWVAHAPVKRLANNKIR